jgi:putative membrane protein
MKTNLIASKSIRILACQAIATLCVLAQVAVTAVQADDTNTNRGQLSASDYRFACNAATGGMMEINLGKLAQQKSSDPAVQQFGERMVQDHTKAADQLQQIVSSKNATLPSEMTASERKEMDKFNNLSGEEFDKAYAKMMIKGHKSMLRMFEHESKHADDADIKNFAVNTTPTVQEHLTMAESLKKDVKSGNNTSTNSPNQ